MIKQFLSCDWGTSSFRLRLLDASDNAVLATVTERKGIADTYNKWVETGLQENERITFYKNVLLQYITQLNANVLGLPILMSGMASSSIGIKEIPYGNLPFDFQMVKLPVEHLAKDQHFNHDIFMIGGLKTGNDAMRGEETILFGCDVKDVNGIFIFPGTHSKHVFVESNKAINIKSYMTGEVFDLLVNKSILSTSVLKNEEEHMQVFFTQGVQDAMNGSFLNIIFHVRTNLLFKKLEPEENYHYLSGLLIGTELKEIPVESNVFIVSENRLLNYYLKAAEVLQLHNVTGLNADEAFINAHLKLGKLLVI